MKLDAFPYVLDANDNREPEIKPFWQSNRAAIDRALLEHGAILLKNFSVDSILKFDDFMGNASVKLANYIDGNSPRLKLTGGVYTSTEYPADAPISLHNELSYSEIWPARLYFCCVTPAHTGGSTTIANSRSILKNLPPEIVKIYEEKGVIYVRNLRSDAGVGVGKSWQQTFETTRQGDVETYCGDRNIRYKWTSGGGLRLVQVRPAIAIHPETGEKVWFNQADQFHPSTNPPEVYEALQELYGDDPFGMPQYSCFGDGSPISANILDEVRATLEQHEVAFSWMRGDLMVIDNMLTAHGRSPYSGERKILVSMSM